MRGIPLTLFKEFLLNCKQYVKEENVISDTLLINCGFPQGSVLGPVLFLIYINDLDNAVKQTEIHHFVDDTNVLYFSKSLKDLNKKVNYDLKNIVKWLRGKKISLNASKTELVLFRTKGKMITKNMNFRISGQKIKIFSKTKYLIIILDENLTFKYHLENLKFKLNRANCLLAKIRYYIKPTLLSTIYYTIFNSHLRYGQSILGIFLVLCFLVLARILL